jgi:glycosyltransferase involved in cell wall biosynthesis
MRIGVDATCWANPRGYGRFTRHLLPAMVALSPADTFVCFLDERAAEAFTLEGPQVERRIVQMGQSPTIAAAANGSRSPIDMLRLTRAVGGAGLDVFFSPSVYTYFPLPPFLRAVVTVHDAIVERFPELTMPGWRDWLFWRMKMKLALAQSQLILTVSDFAASEIRTVLKVDPSRIRVAVEAPAQVYGVPNDDAEVRAESARLGLPAGARWFMYVGGFNPHKNIDTLVKAHAELARRSGADAPHLILVGPTGGDVFHGNLEQIRQLITAEGTAPLVHWPGFIPDERLRLLHAGALALVLPSACEGFGLPAVEAAACGAPVIATTESPLPQLLDGGGIFVRPGDLGGLIAAFETMTYDEAARRAMAACATTRAGELSWGRCARAALDALREAA